MLPLLSTYISPLGLFLHLLPFLYHRELSLGRHAVPWQREEAAGAEDLERALPSTQAANR